MCYDLKLPYPSLNVGIWRTTSASPLSPSTRRLHSSMLGSKHPSSPSLILVEEFDEDPDQHGIDWDGITIVHTDDNGKPSTLPLPCERFNRNACLCQSTCTRPHVCSTCLEADHCAYDCPRKVEQHASSGRNRKGLRWDNNVSYSPCAQASLHAEPLPMPPHPSELPPELVAIVRDHPELFKITTPINVSLLEGLLATHPNPKFVGSVIRSLREGFWPYASCPSILPNEHRRQKHYCGPKQKFLEDYVKEEIKTRRFSYPFGRKLLPGMACMPVHVVQNPAKTKFRLIHDHSAGESSLNSLIPGNERSAQVDKIDALVRVLRNRQLDLSIVVLFKSDISHAFRILPMSPYWQALQAVYINGSYYIDRCNTFGNAASQRIFCAFYSLVLWIAENIWGLSDIFSFVDDNFSWELSHRMRYYRPYAKQLPEKQARLLEIWDSLGIPHAIEKQEFKQVLTVIGFQVNLRQMRVTVRNERLERLVSSLSEFGSITTAPLQECQKLAGSVNWVFEVNPLLRPGILSLHNEMAKVNQSVSNAHVAITKRVASDLRWLAKILHKSRGVHFTRMFPWGPDNIHQTVYIHASTEGFGVWFPSASQAFYYKHSAPVPDAFISATYSFLMVCAIHEAKKFLKRLEQKPASLAVFTRDGATIKMFDRLRANDELHHVLLIAVKLLTKADMDYVVSDEGNSEDFAFAARLSCEPNDILDADYPDITIKELIIPEKLAIRAQWASPSQTSDEKRDEKARRGKLLLKKAGRSKAGITGSLWDQGRYLMGFLTGNSR